MRGPRIAPVLAALTIYLAACAPAAPAPRGAAGGGGEGGAPSGGRGLTLTLVVRYEVSDLGAKVVAGGPSSATKREFNAALSLIDGTGSPQPYLAASLPQVNTDSWQVTPDNHMETTYRLKPNLTWHDGSPLTADDFVFAYHVYTAPGIGGFISKPQDQIESVEAPDPRTVVIRWRSLYPGAGSLSDGDLDPLPRHILSSALDAFLQDPTDQDVLMGSSFWTTDYVGAGPFKLVEWTQGTSIEGSAFDGHALGRPKIDRLVVRFIPDENTAMTNLLAGSADIATDNALRFEHAIELQRQWGPDNRGGTVLMRPGTRHQILVQFRSDFLKTRALSDVRVRRALMHAIDRQALNDALFENQGLMAESFVPPGLPYYDDVQRAITRYPFDPTRTEQLMNEAGYSKDASGTFVSASGERFRPTVQTDSGAQFDREMSIIQDGWARIGIDIQPVLLAAVQVRNNEVRNTFPDLYITSTGVYESALNIFYSGEIGTAANRWAGNDRNGWVNPEVDRLWQAFNSTLDRSQRNQDIVSMMKIISDEVPSLPLYFNISPIGFVASLKGPAAGTTETLEFWNVAEWTKS
ncbi:MAG TPA: peptide ABC transporter substrate-binding protein [Chloroflexota bacterium]|nr:peptide ABC transporter substrate-binding protein [Chloroflexota bacterium]